MTVAPLLPFFFLGAGLYTSVGHGGATLYLAILVLAGYSVNAVATTVLVLNVVAALIAVLHFRAAGHLRWPLLWPFLATSVPAAYAGGRLPLQSDVADAILGVGLLAAAARFFLVRDATPAARPVIGRTFLLLALALGLVLGFLAGATGIGGGIFLSPILVLAGWANVKEAGSVAGAFIVVNSIVGLAARLPRQALDLDLLTPLLAVVALGALVGGFLGARRVPPRGLQILLGFVLVAAVVRIAIDQGLLEAFI